MKAKDIAKGGLFTAIGFIFLYLSSIMITNKLALIILSSAVIPLTVLACDIKTGILVYVSTSIISLFLPNKGISIMYILLFGIYGIVKYYIEKLNKLILEYILKYLFFNVSLSLCYYLYTSFFTDIISSKLPIWILIILSQILFFIYDYILTGFISYFINKFKDILKRS